MATNWGDAFLVAMRTLLTGIAVLPSTRAWMNTNTTPSATEPFVADRVVSFDSVPAECGPGARKRRTVAYQVLICWPTGRDGFDTLALSAAVEDAVTAASDAGTLTIPGADPLELLSTRAGPTSDGEPWLTYPVTLLLTFDHP